MRPRGDTIISKNGIETADQSGIWHSGTSIELNLTTSTINNMQFIQAVELKSISNGTHRKNHSMMKEK
jgi:hypothetical protein